MNYFKISDYNISGRPIPEDVADKILKYHIEPMNALQSSLPFDVRVSARSGYRSREWEHRKGRSGNSQHCFKGNGAVDITCEDFDTNFEELLQGLINCTEYTRIAVYKSFIHVDYGHAHYNRWVFNSKWERLYKV